MVLFFGDSSHSLPIPQYFATQGSIGCGPVRKIRETSRFRHGLRTTSKAIPERLIPQIHVRFAFSDRCALVHDFKLSWIEFQALRSSKIFSRLKLFKSFGYEVVRLFSSFFLVVSRYGICHLLVFGLSSFIKETLSNILLPWSCPDFEPSCYGFDREGDAY